jgi:hypothetical protein
VPPPPEKILELVEQAVRAELYIRKMLAGMWPMHRLNQLPSTYPIRNNPVAEEWWRNWEKERDQKLGELRRPYDEMGQGLDAMLDNLLDAAEMPSIRGDGLDISALRATTTMLRGYNSISSPLPPLHFDPLLINLEKLQRRLRILANESRPKGKTASGRKRGDPIAGPEAIKRNNIIRKWDRAKGTMTRQVFCEQEQIELSYLEKCQDWKSTQKRRKG